MQQGTLLVLGLIIALTIAYGSAFEAPPVSTNVDVVESPGLHDSDVKGFAEIRRLATFAE